jgi:hypothetical protein
MSKRVLIGLLAVSILAMWGSAANAFNRINGIIIRHSDLVAEVTLCGDPRQETRLTILLEVVVEILCKKKHYGGYSYQTQTVMLTFDDSQTVLSADFTGDSNPPVCNHATALKTFVFDLSSAQCSGYKFKKVPNSEEPTSVDATATWECIGTGPQCPSAPTLIEEVETTCTPEDEHTLLCDEPEHVEGTISLPPPPSVPVSKDDCKKGGWKNLVDSKGNPFKNQGGCVSFVATGGSNLGAKKP